MPLLMFSVRMLSILLLLMFSLLPPLLLPSSEDVEIDSARGKEAACRDLSVPEELGEGTSEIFRVRSLVMP